MNIALSQRSCIRPSLGGPPKGGRLYHRLSPYRGASKTALRVKLRRSIARTTATGAASTANRVT